MASDMEAAIAKKLEEAAMHNAGFSLERAGLAALDVARQLELPLSCSRT